MSNIKIRDATIGFLAGAIITLGGVKLCGTFLKGKKGKDEKLPSMGSVVRKFFISDRHSPLFFFLTHTHLSNHRESERSIQR